MNPAVSDWSFQFAELLDPEVSVSEACGSPDPIYLETFVGAQFKNHPKPSGKSPHFRSSALLFSLRLSRTSVTMPLDVVALKLLALSAPIVKVSLAQTQTEMTGINSL